MLGEGVEGEKGFDTLESCPSKSPLFAAEEFQPSWCLLMVAELFAAPVSAMATKNYFAPSDASENTQYFEGAKIYPTYLKYTYKAAILLDEIPIADWRVLFRPKNRRSTAIVCRMIAPTHCFLQKSGCLEAGLEPAMRSHGPTRPS